MTPILLENPIWNALSTEHLHLTEGDDHARRYPADIGPLAGIPNQSEASYGSLGKLAGEFPVVLFSLDPIRAPEGWSTLRTGKVVQMIRNSPAGAPGPSSSGTWDASPQDRTLRRLTPADASAMVALAELTEPGPFRLRTLELGNFYGIFHRDQLVAMAGKRMHLPGLVEVSGVCTHPDVRGRGYARELTQIAIGEIEDSGRTAFLHAWADNPAVRLYESLGFAISRQFHLAVLMHKV
ncbi:MAG TPA: GNAT family N-acetyltransferase [Terracidiphilus sp.]|jgi:GNAT superfamily N-acetyltransferase